MREETPNRVDYWLAPVDQYGTAFIKDGDGAHDDVEGAYHALYLIQRMGLCKDKKWAVVRVEYLDENPEPNPEGANEETLDFLNAAFRGEKPWKEDAKP